MSPVTFMIWAFLIYQLCRLVKCLPDVFGAVSYKCSGQEQRDVKSRQDRAIKRRIAEMDAHLEQRRRSHAEAIAVRRNPTADEIRSLNFLHESFMSGIRQSCASDIERIRKSYWGYKE